uniref:Peptidase S1 domain-containing protein n=1 Tax=Sparus aurata TaxID=8175 RepID=A0A671VXW9_SPAAU
MNVEISVALKTVMIYILMILNVVTVLDLQRRTIVDHTCKVNERLYHVKLTSTKGIQYIPCGGSLISKSWILTAAHCWRDGWTITAEVGVHPGPGRPVQITAKPEIFIDVKNRKHDIMLLRLPDSTQGNHIIPLPDCGKQPAEFSKTYVLFITASKTLQCADLTVFPCKVVNKYFTELHKTLKQNNASLSQGDSGGGVEYNGKIYGVIRSSEEPDLCYPEAGFLKVCEYIDWINKIITKK